MVNNNLFFSAREVADFFSVSIPTAYKMIQQMNQELRSMGYLTVSGKISRNYFETKVYGGLKGTEYYAGQ